MPRVAPYVLRKEERAARFSVGITLYAAHRAPARLHLSKKSSLAAAGWGYLAFGDGFASICGMTVGGPRLPWNPKKSLSGFLGYLVFGFLGAALLYGFVAARVPSALGARVRLRRCARGAGRREPSLRAGRQRPAAARRGGGPRAPPPVPARACSDALEPAGLRGFAVALAINAAVVRPRGGSARRAPLRRRRGRAPRDCRPRLRRSGPLRPPLGLLPRRHARDALPEGAQGGDGEGRRGGRPARRRERPRERVRARVLRRSSPAWGRDGDALRLAAAAALATALMDTVGTEVGQAFASPTVLLPDFRRVPPGTDGAVSVAGTLAGLAAAGLLAWVGVAGLRLHGPGGRRRRPRGPPRDGPREPARAARARRGASRTATS